MKIKPTEISLMFRMAEQLNTGLVLLNSTYQVLELNQVANEVLSLEDTDCKGLFVKDLFEIQTNSNQLTSLCDIHEAQSSDSKPEDFDFFKITLKNYDERLVNLSFVEIEGEKESESIIFLAVQDITVSQDSHVELKKREEQFRLIFDNSPAGICFYDSEGTILQVNEEFAFIIGAPKERMIGLNMVRDIKNKEVIAQVRQSLQKKLGFYEGVYLSVTGKKETFVRCFFNPVLGERNEFIGGVCVVNDLTESQKDKKRIEYLYANITALVESSQDGVFTLDRDGNYLFYNSTHENMVRELWGYDTIQLGINIYDYLPESISHVGFSERLRTVFSGEPLMFEVALEVQKELKHFNINMNPVSTVDDEIIAASVFMRDVTKEYESNNQIKLNEQLLNSITSNLTEAVYRSSKEKGLIYANDAFYEMFGFQRDEYCDDKILALLYESPGLRDTFLAELDKALKVSNRELRMRKKDGTEFWALLNVSKIESENGSYYDGVITNIDDRIRNELQLKESEDSYRKLFENAGEPIYVLNESFEFVDLNSEACKMFGKPKDFLIGKKPQFITDSEINDLVHIKEILKKAFKGIPQTHVIYGKRFTGEVFPKKLRLQKSTYFGKSVLIAFVEDITQIKQQEDERNRMIQDLTRQNRDLQHFSYVISHDLRAPVANILSLSSIFEMADLDEETNQKIIAGLKQSTLILDKTIRDLNEVLSIRNDVHAQKEYIYFNDVMLSVQTSLSRQIMQSNAKITYDFKEIDGFFSIHPYIHSVFFNLVSNAIKYQSPDRSPEIRVVSKRKPGKIEVEFHDNGLGINLDKNRKKLFDIYQRFHTHVEGRGLGLYLVKTQVEALSGTIEVKSNLGLGSIFTIIFAYD